MRRLALISALLLCAVVSQASVSVPPRAKPPQPPRDTTSQPSQKAHQQQLQLPAEVRGNVDPHPYVREFYPPPDQQQSQPPAGHQATAQ